MIYSDRQIIESIEKGEIVCDPFRREHVQGTSYDVRLGRYFFRTERSNMPDIFNPYSQTETERYFGAPLETVLHEAFIDEYNRKPFENIPLDARIIVLGPGERILAHTLEFIGGAPGSDVTTTMQARSTTGRVGYAVCHDAGWGDPGYFNRWTMEIQNVNREHGLVIVEGERVAQLVFLATGPVEKFYKSKYQEGDFADLNLKDTVELIKAQWQPADMLPRLYKDPIRVPEAVLGIKVDA